MKNARILQIIPRLHGGGAEAEALLIARAIIDAGGEAYVASQGGQLVPLLENSGAHHIPLPLASKSPYTMWRNVYALQEVVQTHKISLLHVRSRAPAWSVAVCARRLNLPWITTYHNGYSATNRLKHAYNSIMARAHRVIAISAFIENLIQTTYHHQSWFQPEHVRLVPRGIDLDAFSPHHVEPQTLQTLRQDLHILPHTPIILLPGRFSKRKGQELLLQAFATLAAQGQKGVLIFLGKTSDHDPYHISLLQQANALRIAPHVRFLPYHTDVRPFYALADIVVIPSITPEGFGRVTAEAAAFKKVVIGSAHGATPEILPSEKIGFLVTPGDNQALAEALQKALVLSPQERQKMGENARAHITTHFSGKQFYEKTLAVYQELL